MAQWASVTNITQGCKGLPVTNTQADWAIHKLKRKCSVLNTDPEDSTETILVLLIVIEFVPSYQYHRKWKTETVQGLWESMNCFNSEFLTFANKQG